MVLCSEMRVGREDEMESKELWMVTVLEFEYCTGLEKDGRDKLCGQSGANNYSRATESSPATAFGTRNRQEKRRQKMPFSIYKVFGHRPPRKAPHRRLIDVRKRPPMA